MKKKFTTTLEIIYLHFLLNGIKGLMWVKKYRKLL